MNKQRKAYIFIIINDKIDMILKYDVSEEQKETKIERETRTPD